MGTYRFRLVVNDGKVDSEPDYVVFTSITPIRIGWSYRPSDEPREPSHYTTCADDIKSHYVLRNEQLIITGGEDCFAVICPWSYSEGGGLSRATLIFL